MYLLVCNAMIIFVFEVMTAAVKRKVLALAAI